MMSSSTSEAQHCCHDSHVPREPYNVSNPLTRNHVFGIDNSGC